MVELVEVVPENAGPYPLRRTRARTNQMNDSQTAAVAASPSTENPKQVVSTSRRPARKGKEKKRKLEKEEDQMEVDPVQAVEEVVEIVEANAVPVVPAAAQGNAHALVTDTLRTFSKHYLHFIQVEEKRAAEQKADNEKKTKVKGTTEDPTKNPSKRPDLKAITQMMNTNTAIFREKRVGPIPGIDVGHQFFSRAEMVVVGLHGHWLNGINYIGKTASITASELGLMEFQLPLTVSIVLSGQYEDDVDNCEDIVYTGQGGNDLLGNKRQIKDQVLERGNLGLKHCMDFKVPVRVIRGRESNVSYVGKVYTYDGLYKVVQYWAEKGVSGFTVFKYRLKRDEGQLPLVNDQQILFTRGRIPETLSEIRGLMCKDITGGLEDLPMVVTNLVDPPISLEGFPYITEMLVSDNVELPKAPPRGCNCRGGLCTDARTCYCAQLNGGDFPYVLRDGGRLVRPKAVVFECGPSCGCGPECVNRTSQRSPKFRLEIFRTPKKGWGVRSWDYIPSGAPVCEYIGQLKKTSDIDPAADNSYVFDIDCLQTMKGMDGRESRLEDVSLPKNLQKIMEEVSDHVPYCIDAVHTGNLTRFINHSCLPNLFVQCILSDHHDIRLARIVLIAADNIPPLKELSYDYGYAIDSVVGLDGEIQQCPCYCGAEGCRKRLY